MKEFTPEELSAYNGKDGQPLYIAVRGQVFDVTEGSSFYGPGGPYECFAGRECSRALGIMKVEASECNDNLSDLTDKQLQILQDWILYTTSTAKALPSAPLIVCIRNKEVHPEVPGRWQGDSTQMTAVPTSASACTTGSSQVKQDPNARPTTKNQSSIQRKSKLIINAVTVITVVVAILVAIMYMTPQHGQQQAS